jgi:hypothetical protein
VPYLCRGASEVVGVAGFEPATPSSRTRCPHANYLKIQAGSRGKTVNVNETFGYFRAVSVPRRGPAGEPVVSAGMDTRRPRMAVWWKPETTINTQGVTMIESEIDAATKVILSKSNMLEPSARELAKQILRAAEAERKKFMTGLFGSEVVR